MLSADATASLRIPATAFLAATTAALVIDALLQLAMDAVRVSSFGGSPWWITANLVERGRWVVFALAIWLIAPWFAERFQVSLAASSPAAAWRAVAIATGGVPVAWIAATWVVSAVRFTLLGSWDSDGRVFVSPDYYRGLLLDLAPWLLASAAVFTIGRHVE